MWNPSPTKQCQRGDPNYLLEIVSTTLTPPKTFVFVDLLSECGTVGLNKILQVDRATLCHNFLNFLIKTHN